MHAARRTPPTAPEAAGWTSLRRSSDHRRGLERALPTALLREPRRRARRFLHRRRAATLATATASAAAHASAASPAAANAVATLTLAAATSSAAFAAALALAAAALAAAAARADESKVCLPTHCCVGCLITAFDGV